MSNHMLCCRHIATYLTVCSSRVNTEVHIVSKVNEQTTCTLPVSCGTWLLTECVWPQAKNIHLIGGVYGIYTLQIEQPDWSNSSSNVLIRCGSQQSEIIHTQLPQILQQLEQVIYQKSVDSYSLRDPSNLKLELTDEADQKQESKLCLIVYMS